MIPLRSTERVYSFPTVTVLLIVANTVLFFYEMTLGPYAMNRFVMRYGIVPDRLHMASLFTSMFLHGGWLHLIGNMWFLWIFGRNVEDGIRPGRFLVFYLVCGLVGAIAYVLLNPFSPAPTIGASGAIAGVMGAYLVMFPHARVVTLIPIIIFFTTIELPAAFLLLYWFVIQFFSGVGSMTETTTSSGGVAWFAHVGGFLAGMLLIKFFRPKRRFPRWYAE